jgi:hypothetical protein
MYCGQCHAGSRFVVFWFLDLILRCWKYGNAGDVEGRLPVRGEAEFVWAYMYITTVSLSEAWGLDSRNIFVIYLTVEVNVSLYQGHLR